MKCLILNSRRPIPVASYQCISAWGRGAILEANPRYTFSLSPPAATVRLAETLDFTDSGARGDCLDARNVAYDLEVHDLSWQEASVWSKEQKGAGGKPPNY